MLVNCWLCVSNLVSIINTHIDFIQKIFSIVGSLSIFIALAAYIYKKRQDKLLAAVDQITFFRENIIVGGANLTKKILQENPNWILSRIEFDEPTFDEIREKYGKNFERQLAVFFNNESKYPEAEIKPILDEIIIFLNLLEEFSLKVKYLKTSEGVALRSIQASFIQIVESYAVPILFVRNILYPSDIMYSATIELYREWKKNTKKPPNIIHALEDNKLITKKQRQDFFENRRKVKGY